MQKIHRNAVEEFRRRTKIRSYGALQEAIDKTENKQLVISNILGVLKEKLTDGYILVRIPSGQVLGPICPYKNCKSYTGGGHRCSCYLAELERVGRVGPVDPKVDVLLTEDQIRKCFEQADAIVSKQQSSSGAAAGIKTRIMNALQETTSRKPPPIVIENASLSMNRRLGVDNLMITTRKGQFQICSEKTCLRVGLHLVANAYVCSSHTGTCRDVASDVNMRRVQFTGMIELYHELSKELNPDASRFEKWCFMLQYFYALKGSFAIKKNSAEISVTMNRALQWRIYYKHEKRPGIQCISPFCFHGVQKSVEIQDEHLDGQVTIIPETCLCPFHMQTMSNDEKRLLFEAIIGTLGYNVVGGSQTRSKSSFITKVKKSSQQTEKASSNEGI